MSWQARVDGLIVTDVGEDLVVYDDDRQAIHTLNPLAATIWRRCDGTTSEEQMAAALGVSADTIAAAITLLHNALLITGTAGDRTPSPRPHAVSRRRVMRQAGVAGIALPAIVSITAPRAHAALSDCPDDAIPASECTDNDGVACWKDSETCGRCTKTVIPPPQGCGFLCVEGEAWSCS